MEGTHNNGQGPQYRLDLWFSQAWDVFKARIWELVALMFATMVVVFVLVFVFVFAEQRLLGIEGGG